MARAMGVSDPVIYPEYQQQERNTGYPRSVTPSGSRSGPRPGPSPGGGSLTPNIRQERSMHSRDYRSHAFRGQDSKHPPAPSPSYRSGHPNFDGDTNNANKEADYYNNADYDNDPHNNPTALTTPFNNFNPNSHSQFPELAPYPSTPRSPRSPRWDSLAHGNNPYYDRAAVSTPASPVSTTFPSRPANSTGEPEHDLDTFDSEIRDEFAPLPTTKLNSAEPLLVDNFSRPRGASIKQPYQESPRGRPTNYPQTEQNHPDMNHPISWPRERGQSISSNQSTATYASLPTRSDIYARENVRGRGRQPNPPPTRPPVTYRRAESSEPAFARDPMPRMASAPNDELRSSFRSQLSASTAQGTVATERSSVATKSSSVTSVYGGVDDGLSVEDVMGMYMRGFCDDSAPEDNDEAEGSRPPTGRSELSRRKTAMLEAMGDPITMLKPPVEASDEGPAPRDSTAILGLIDRPASSPTTASPPIALGGLAEAAEERRGTNLTHLTTLTTTDDEGRDRYGFRKGTQYITREQYDGWNQGYTDYLARRRKKWLVFLKENGLMTDSPNRFPPRSAKAKRFVRKGIPPDWRGAAWFYYAGGPAIVAKHAGLYDDLLTRRAKDVDIDAIERDLHRTFPDNIRFRSQSGLATPDSAAPKRNSVQTLREGRKGEDTAMIVSLRRVLRAFSIYNPRIGYCQSLNFIAGLLLLFVESEEHAFWLLNIITRVHLPGTHETSLEGANVDLGVLMSALRESMPAVWAKIGGELDGTDVARPRGRRPKNRVPEPTRLPPITLCMTAWFMSCYIGTLPIESTLRVWDVFFYEGSKTLFRIALAIFKIGEGEIKAVRDPMEIFQVVQTIPRRLLDANGLMEACFRRRNGFGHLSQETVDQKRQERREQVKAEREKRMSIRDGGVVADIDVKRKHTLFSRHRDRDMTFPAAMR
ncbi:RabGAP/TBC [Whalleya microplaca]|nr:RabGAP/TBC [Whalleya microplaca]